MGKPALGGRPHEKKRCLMSSIDFQKIDSRKTGTVKNHLPAKSHLSDPAALKPVGPVRDLLGISFFVFYLAVCIYIVCGWLVPIVSALVFYLAFLPLIAMQWLINRGACIISNIETFLRIGLWRDPKSAQEGRFISMATFRLFGLKRSPGTIDALSFGALFSLWLLGFAHLSALGDPALLALFP
jgi:hypothetical protein